MVAGALAWASMNCKSLDGIWAKRVTVILPLKVEFCIVPVRRNSWSDVTLIPAYRKRISLPLEVRLKPRVRPKVTKPANVTWPPPCAR